MLRGVSLTPQERAVKVPHDLPSELKSSILGVPLFDVPPDYGSTGVSRPGFSVRGASSPAWCGVSQTQGLSRRPALASLMSRMCCTKHRDPRSLTGQVPVFDDRGHLTAHQVGVNTFRFRSLSLFYFLRSQSWTILLTYSVALYLIIVLLITGAYYAWGMACGAQVNVVSAIYFTVVSLAANGGYMGEDEDVMSVATHRCYSGRTAIVMVCSYVNILFVGLVATLVVGKAAHTDKLGHRVVFSDFCTLTSLPGRANPWRLVFRMANVDNHIPLARGKLRLFCVTAEPLKEYHIQQHQPQALRDAHLVKELAGSTGECTHQHLPRVVLVGGDGEGKPQRTAVPATESDENRHAAKAQKRRKKERSRQCSPPAPHDSAGRSSREDKSRPAPAQRHHRRRKQRDQQLHTTGSGIRAGEAASQGGHRGQRSEGRGGVQCTEREAHQSALSSPSRSSSASSSRTTASSTLSTSASSSHSSGASSSCAASAVKRSVLPTGIPEPDVSLSMQSHGFVENNGHVMERVHLCVREMRWTCAGERYLDHGESGQLSLWYPTEIIHIIDERSPLHPFLELPHVAASLGSGGTSAEVPSTFASRADVVRAHFQIVAVFDATEMESGSTITAKRTYTSEEIITHYKFSDRLVHIHSQSNEVMLDFHYFNSLLPVDLVEPSTTESDV
ncbi:hypothetical protein Q4I32_001473 [Leishmania shawi]|uniref:Inward rectifier potassium channel C-terminal domain-containing protein n=1 Tax=Leishmania shawi TaxID=5680 RepID=A0AAW3C5Q8_9TRYP